MKFKSPAPNATFTISSKPEWPSINFETDAEGPHAWHWTVSWGSFKKSGVQNTAGAKWDAKAVVENLGGTLTVRAAANKEIATINIKIVGANPSSTEVIQYLGTKANSAGFDNIIKHESKFAHFNNSKEPIRSFDNGYGMCQLTTPAPKFEEVWNWKLNVDGGLKLFEQKRTAAIAYLSQKNRAYTADQLKHETVCRWNGGSYHEWDDKGAKWIRKSTILCDGKTGNIGWDMTDEANKGKTEAQLHERDKEGYSKPPAAGAHWMYSGVCYADNLLD